MQANQSLRTALISWKDLRTCAVQTAKRGPRRKRVLRGMRGNSTQVVSSRLRMPAWAVDTVIKAQGRRRRWESVRLVHCIDQSIRLAGLVQTQQVRKRCCIQAVDRLVHHQGLPHRWDLDPQDRCIFRNQYIMRSILNRAARAHSLLRSSSIRMAVNIPPAQAQALIAAV